MLSELLADENNSLWSQVLYGISVGDGEIVTVALSQVGNIGGQPYWSWYGSIPVSMVRLLRFVVRERMRLYRKRVIQSLQAAYKALNGLWKEDNGRTQLYAEAGHIIFFDWEGDGLTDHVGIVERVENGTVYTLRVTLATPVGRTATLSAAALSMATVFPLIKNGQKKTRGYSSGSFALHSPLIVASITESSLSSQLSSRGHTPADGAFLCLLPS